MDIPKSPLCAGRHLSVLWPNPGAWSPIQPWALYRNANLVPHICNCCIRNPELRGRPPPSPPRDKILDWPVTVFANRRYRSHTVVPLFLKRMRACHYNRASTRLNLSRVYTRVFVAGAPVSLSKFKPRGTRWNFKFSRGPTSTSTST